jgi:hypothetical protein
LISRRRSLWSEALVAQGAAMGDLSAFVAISLSEQCAPARAA